MIVPIIMHIDTILGVWLVEVPDHSNSFVSMILIYTAVECFISPILVTLLATGKIKNYEIGITIIYVINILSVYLFFKWGSVPEVAFILNIVFKVMVLLLLFYQGKRQFQFPVGRFVKEAMLRPVVISFIGLAIILLYRRLIEQTSIASFIVSCFITEVCLITAVWLYGMTVAERFFLKETVIKKYI